MAEEGHLHQQVRHARRSPRRRAPLAQVLRDRGLAAPQPLLSELDPQQRRDGTCRPLVNGRDPQRRIAASVRRVDVRAVLNERVDNRFVAQEGRRMEGGAAGLIDDVDVRAAPDEQLDGLRATRPRRPQQRRRPGFAVRAVDRSPTRQAPLDGAKVSRVCGRPDVRRPPGRRDPAGLPGGGRHHNVADPHRGRDDGDHPQQQGEEHPEEPVLDQRPAAPPVQQHRAEEAAHDEEERHPEPVDGGEDDPESGILLTIRHDPERRDERHGGVQDDPEEHGDGPQGVQVGSSGKGRILDGQGRHGCEAPPELFTIRDQIRSGQKSPIVLLFYCNSTS